MPTISRGTMLVAGALMAIGLAAPASAAGCDGEYTVRPGDTLSRIAAECGVSVGALMGANPHVTSPSALSIGWKLAVPGEGQDAGEQLAAIPETEGPVTLEGWIVNGRRCAMLATADGEEYGVVSPDHSFVSGRAVAVQGQIIDDPTCSGPNTLLVTDLKTTEL
jgi:LysM repeat protein